MGDSLILYIELWAVVLNLSENYIDPTHLNTIENDNIMIQSVIVPFPC